MDDDRLSRIEEKLDKMSDAIVSLARMEERMISLFKRMDIYDDRQNEIGKRVGVVENKIAASAWMERLTWILVGGAVAVAVALLK